MAINSDKLLNRPSELHRRYGGRLAMQKAQQEKMVSGGPVNIVLTKKSIKNIETIKVKVVQIESILKGTLASEKKALDEKKRKDSRQRREKLEEKLETKPNVEKGSIKMPSAPRMGILDWIKNFIGNVLLGYFAVRLVDHLPKIIPIVKFLGNAADFIINVGGKLLNGLVTFIDWGYRAYDATRGFIKGLGGENFAQGFDKFVGAIDTTLFLATIIAGDLLSEYLFGDGGSRGGTSGPGRRGGRPQVTTSGGRAAGRPDIRNPLRQRPTVTTGQGGKPGGIRLPGTGPKVTGSGGGPKIKVPKGMKARGGLLGLIFLIPDLIDAGMLVSQGRGKDGLRALLSAVSGVVAGMAAYSATLAGAAALGITGVGLPAAIGLALAGFGASTLAGTAAYNLTDAGLKKMGLFDKDPKTGKPYTYRSGGITRGGKRQTGARRSIGGTRRGKYKRVVPRKPGEIEIKPGADIGGEDKILGIFPKPKIPDFINPFKVVKTAGEDLGKTDYFGPILAITSKITLGQKPTQRDYENVGLGINMLIAKGIQEKQLKGGVVAAFAEGGLVDPDVLSAAETGGDISNWVAKTFRGEIESNAQKTLRMIRENASKEKPEKSEKYKVDESGDPSLDVDFGGATVTGGNADFWTLVAISRMEDSDPQGSADVAQSIYNRVASGIYGGKTIKEIVLRQGQYEPTWKYPKRGKTGIPNPEWHSIKDLKTASVATGISQSDLQKTAAALRNAKYQEQARKFVGGRTDFMGGANRPGPGDIRRKENAPNNFFGWFVGPAAKAYGAKNPGPAKVPQLGDIVVMSGVGGQEPLGKGYGSSGSKIAGELGRYVKKKLRQGPDFSLVHRHPEHPPYSLSSGHSSGSLHYQGRAVDIGAYTREQGPILKVISEFNKMKGVRPAQLLHGRNEPSGHSNHVHVAYFHGENFGIVPFDGFTLKLHKGEMFKVIDKDSVNLLGFDLTKEIIDIENQSQLAAKAPSIIEKLKAISGYASYEEGAPQTIVVPVSAEMGGGYGDSEESGGGVAFIPVGGGSDPFESLHRGG